MRRSGQALLWGAATAALSQPASAMSVTYNFVILITQQDDQGICPAVGSLMPMTLTADRAFPPTPPQNDIEAYQGGPAFGTASPILSVSINNAPAYEPLQDNIYVTKGYQGSYGYSFLGFDFGEGFALDFSTTNRFVVPNYRIPPRIIPRTFMIATFTYTAKESACLGQVLRQ